MALFEFDAGRLIPAQFGRPVADGLEPEVVEAIRNQVLEVVARPLFPVAWSDDGASGSGFRGSAPRLTALDPTGQVVSIEVLPELDSTSMMEAFGRLSEVANLGWAALSMSYPGGPDAFRVGWAQFREAMPTTPESGPRLILVVGQVKDDVRPALAVLADSGLEIHEISVREMSNGRRFLDVNIVAQRRWSQGSVLVTGRRVRQPEIANWTGEMQELPGGRETSAEAVTSAAAVPAVEAAAVVAPPPADEIPEPTPATAPEPAPEHAAVAEPAAEAVPEAVVPEAPETAEPELEATPAAEPVEVAMPEPTEAEPATPELELVPEAEATGAAEEPEPQVPAAEALPFGDDIVLDPEHATATTAEIPTQIAESPEASFLPQVEDTEGPVVALEPRFAPLGAAEPEITETGAEEELAAEAAPVAAPAVEVSPEPAQPTDEPEPVEPEMPVAEHMQPFAVAEEPALTRNAEGLYAIAAVLNSDTPLLWVRLDDGRHFHATLMADGVISVNGMTTDTPMEAAYLASGMSGVDGWLAWLIGGEQGPSLAEALDEINAEIEREEEASRARGKRK